MHTPLESGSYAVNTSIIGAGRFNHHRPHQNKFKLKLPPYGHAVKQARAKNPDKLIVIRYGNDGWTHAAVENDSLFGDANPQTLVIPKHDHWTNYRWPLYEARVWVDWMFAPQSQTNAFVEYLLKYVRVREVFFYPNPKATELRMAERIGTGIKVHDIGKGEFI